jgi:DNA-binding GntR family transcriptional regulator
MHMNSPNALEVLRTQSLTGLVYEELEKRIASGKILPGVPLREVALANDMGISRGPVREAFRMLEERGLVEFEKNIGVRVRNLDLRQAEYLYQVRIPLEGLIGETATDNMSAALEEAISQVLDRMQDAVSRLDVEAYAALNFQFHDELARGSGNPVLYDAYRRVVVQLNLFRSYSFRHNPATLAGSLQEHRMIFDAIRGRQRERASELLRRHTQASLQKVRAAMEHAGDDEGHEGAR